jgi:Fic family protein
MARYIYQYNQWPVFTWDDKEISATLGKVRHLQGKIFGQMQTLGFSLKQEAILSTLTLDVLKSSEIEGEMLNYEQVRSSIARRLGIEYAGMTHVDRNVEGVVEMMLDATQKYNEPLDYFRQVGMGCIELILVVIVKEKCRLFPVLWERKKYITKPHHIS